MTSPFLFSGLLLLLLPPALAAQGFSAVFEEIKRNATPAQLHAILWDLPKGGDIHNHHELSADMGVWFDWAARHEYHARVRISTCPNDPDPLLWLTLNHANHQALSPCVQRDYRKVSQFTPAQREDWIAAMRLDQPGEGRDEFFERIALRLGDLERDPEGMAAILVAQLEQAAAEHTLYLETQLDPRGFPDADTRAIRRALASPRALATGVAARFQVSTVRFLPDAEESLASAYAFVSKHRDLWVGVNLVGREDNAAGTALRFLNPLRELRRRYFDIPLALHGGESEFPGRQVRDTLLLGASRIGHGVNLITDPDTLLLFRNGPYLVEVSLVSNQALGYVPDVARHPFPEYLRLGVPVCLNTDDRGALESSLTDEYYLAVRHFNLSWAEVERIGRHSLSYSFAEPALKQRLLAAYEERLRRFTAKYASGAWRSVANRLRPAVSRYAERKLGIPANHSVM